MGKIDSLIAHIPDGELIHSWLVDLFPLNRSILGDGVRQTLKYLQKLNPEFAIGSVPTGTKCLDWTIPLEWRIREAWIKDSSGNKIIDFKNNNLHVISYCEPINTKMSLRNLKKHIFTREDLPDAIPYVTSYYERNWGFCMSHNQFCELAEGNYEVFVDSEFSDGELNYGELFIPGLSNEEVLISTYVCHPSMANNELSGPVVASYVANLLSSIDGLRYSYRFVFVPETIGSIAYLARNFKTLKKHVVAGLNLSCIGDELAFSYLPSRRGDTLADRAAKLALRNLDSNFKEYSWLDRGSDERQYCSPGVDLPVASLMRSKYGEYNQYHTSLDDTEFVTPEGLSGGVKSIIDTITILETNWTPKACLLCEPQLGKRGLYQNISKKGSSLTSRLYLNILSLADGKLDLIDLCDVLAAPYSVVYEAAEELRKFNLIKKCEISKKNA